MVTLPIPRRLRAAVPVLVATSCVVAAWLAAAVEPATGASSSGTVVGATVLSSTTLDLAGCATGTPATIVPPIPVSTSAITASPCTVSFGSSNGAGRLAIAQADGAGAAMWRWTDGALDPDFDGPSGTGNGTVQPSYPNATAVAAVAVQPDGKVVIGRVDNTLADRELLVSRILPDGTYDPTFGDAGTTRLNITTGNEDFRSLTLTGDGSILVGAHAYNATIDIAVAKLQPDGELDPSFDGEGGSGNGIIQFTQAWCDGGNDAMRSAIGMPDGRIAVFANCGATTTQVIMLLPDGTRDPDFDGETGNANGKVDYDVRPGSYDGVTAAALTSDGGFILAGASPTDHTPWMMRLDSQGRRVTTFDGASGTGSGIVLLPGTLDVYALAWIAELVDGDFVLVAPQTSGAGTMLVRVDADGVLVADFDGGTGDGDGRIASAQEPVLAGKSPGGVVVGIDGTIYLSLSSSGLLALDGEGKRDPRLVGPSGTDAGFVSYGSPGRAFLASGADGRLYLFGGGAPTLRAIAGPTLPDFAVGVADWSTGSDGAFGACMTSLTGSAAAAAGWTPTACTTASAGWNGVPVTPAAIATTSVGEDAAVASLHFGVRSGATTRAGSWVAPVRFEVAAP